MKYKGETGKVWEVSYSLIDYGDGIRCAWCKRKNPSVFHLRFHYTIQKVINLFDFRG